MWYTTVGPHIDVELIGVSRRSFFVNALEDFLFGPCSLAATNDFTIAFWCQKVVAKHVLVIFRIHAMVERLGDFGVVGEEVRNIEILG